MKKIYAIALLLVLTSCMSAKKILYFQDIDNMVMEEIQAEYITRIAKDDLLNITVIGENKETSMPYNLTLNDAATGNITTQTLLPYLVDSEGNIEMPMLGKVHAEGLTRMELTNYLTQRIAVDLKNPVVVVSFADYKITVLGEVNAPGTYTMPSERTTIFQALGMAGDLTITGKRDEIMLIREVEGVNTYTRINLKSARIMNSPYYYLHQNDVLYIPPSNIRIWQGTNATSAFSFAFSSITFLISLLTLLTNYLGTGE